MTFLEYWENYKQTNPGYRDFTLQDAALVGWIGRNAEIEHFVEQIQEMQARLRVIEKEMLRQRIELARRQATDRSED